MSIFEQISQYTASLHERRRRRRTFRQINALPKEIQKDIGWPGFLPETGTGRYGRTRLG